jgi:aldose 1-epimerase
MSKEPSIHHLSSEDLEVEVWSLGARVNRVRFRGSHDLVAPSGSVAEALGKKAYHGAVVGPVANRIDGAKANISGQEVSLEANEGGTTTLHSGSGGVHARDWDIAGQSQSQVVLALSLSDGIDGFPGNRKIRATYSVDGSTLTVVFEATSDAPTLMNLALHPYWTLDGRGREGQKIQVNAATYLPISTAKIPTGQVAPVAGTLFDLRKLDYPDTGIDHNFSLTEPHAPAVRMRADCGLALEIVTDTPGVQIFTGKPIGIAVEPQHWPDAPNHDNFPSILLGPGEIYRQTSTYRFTQTTATVEPADVPG